MTAQFARPQQRGRTGIGQAHEPHAALLIDFDNVTMGIRSDLTKELKNLLNSDIIKGKVAVQRAYADWRRYPQYIVPLAESSVDLIFAPAYGSAKKNATDIRLAIDAIELVFTRPEIGTIILLSGDSDFSSMVLKLKEYGKYVIGVGIRESASDLLVQNCDEYYSYSALTGLTRAGDEAPAVSEDPWELVEMALRQMSENDDVMRSDRLKQVLLELDPSFDEKALGFQKFNKFLQEAASRGLLSLRKQDNGQFEIGPPDAAAVAESQAEARGEARRGRGRRGRVRREEGRREDVRDRGEPRREAPPVAAGTPAGPAPAVTSAPARAAAPAPAVPVTAEAATAGGPAARAKAGPEPAGPVEAPPRARAAATKPDAEIAKPKAEAGKRPESVPERPEPALERPARARPAVGPARPEAATPEPERRPVPAESAPTRAREAKPGVPGDLAASYDLLRRAASDLVRKSGQAARDSDVKRRMLELEAGWDESALGFSKFSRFLRQAHDAEVITLRKGENGVYDVLPGDGEAAPAEEPSPERERGRGRAGRGRADRDRQTPLDGVRGPAAAGPAVAPAARATEAPPKPGARPPAAPREAPASRPERSAQPPAQAAAPPGAPAAQKPAPPAAAQAPAAGQKPSAAQPAALLFRRGSRGRGAPTGPPPLLEGQMAAVRLPAPKTAAQQVQPEAAPVTAAPAQPEPPAEAAPDSVAAELGLPQKPDEVAGYISATYKGVGPKSVQTLIDEFGAARVFDALEKLPDRVRELLGAGRGERLLAAWREDAQKRRGDAGGATAQVLPGAGKTAAKRPARTGGQTPPARRGRGAAKAAATPESRDGAASTAATPAGAAQSASPAPAAKRGGRSGAGRESRRGKPPAK